MMHTILSNRVTLNRMALNKMAWSQVVRVSVPLVLLLIGGCASQPTKPTYVSSAIYKNYSCSQLAAEYRRVNRYISTNAGSRAVFDTSGVGVGITANSRGVFPQISVGMGRSSEMQNIQLSRTLGERDAIAEAARFQGCDFPMPHLNRKK